MKLDESKIKLQLIHQKLRIIKASRANLQAFILANLWAIKAIKLGNPRQTASGVTVVKHRFPGAFVAKMPRTKHVGVFKRKTRKRLPTREQYVFLDPDASKSLKKRWKIKAFKLRTPK
jgi:hypothetical protein